MTDDPNKTNRSDPHQHQQDPGKENVQKKQPMQDNSADEEQDEQKRQQERQRQRQAS